VGEARGLGMMAALEIVQDKKAKKTFDRSRKVGESLHAAATERGLFSRVRDDVYVLAPPLVTSRQELDRIVSILGDAIHAVLGNGTAA
jgi:L-2,4-diaminobutyrate transaminase